MATEFERIKRAVEEEKRKTVQGEAKFESLQSEKTRILEETAKIIGYEVKTAAEIEVILKDRQTEIENEILKAKEVLDAEGVEY